MLGQIILRVAMSATQKSVAVVATKFATSATSTLAGCIIQNKIVNKANERIKENCTEETIKKEQGRAIGKSALSAGVCGGVGLILFNGISNIINNS